MPGAGMVKPGAVLGVLRDRRAAISSAAACAPAGGHGGTRLIFPPVINKPSLLPTISIYL